MNEIQLSQLLDQARSFLNEGKHLHAEQIYRRLMREEPRYLQSYFDLASLYAENGNIRSGIRVLEQGLEVFQGNTELLFKLGTLHLQVEDFTKALTCFQKLHRKNLPHVHFNMGIAYFQSGNTRRAEEEFRLTLKISPNFPKIHESLGELLIRRGAYAEAIQHLKAGIGVDPYSWISHYLLGVAYHTLADLKNAYNEFVLAIEMDPKEAHSWQRCGEVLLEMRRYEEAEEYLRKALELRPDFADALANFGQLYLLKGDPIRSAEFFNRALNIDPHHSRARSGKLKTKISQEQ